MTTLLGWVKYQHYKAQYALVDQWRVIAFPLQLKRLYHHLHCYRTGHQKLQMCWYHFFYTVLQRYAHIGLNQNLFRSTILDIITRLLDNAAFVCVHVVGRFSKDFSEVRGLRSRGFQLQVEWMTTVLCAEFMKRSVM